MKATQNTYIDVYYNKEDSVEAKAYGRKLIKRGYELSDQDTGGAYFDYCDQYLKTKSLKTNKTT